MQSLAINSVRPKSHETQKQCTRHQRSKENPTHVVVLHDADQHADGSPGHQRIQDGKLALVEILGRREGRPTARRAVSDRKRFATLPTYRRTVHHERDTQEIVEDGVSHSRLVAHAAAFMGSNDVDTRRSNAQ